MRMPEQNFIQRKCKHCEEEEKVQRKPLASFIQRKESSTGAIASDTVSNQINASKGNGSNMDSNTQSFMQSRFGADFSSVSIHTNGEAIQMNRELNAKAFTVGSDIYFNEGQYNPGTHDGKHLLAHELTHTIQQGDHINRMIQRSPLSDTVNTEWTSAHNKGRVFTILRDNAPSSDADLLTLINSIFPAGSDDRWLATTILQNGPEPLWPNQLLQARNNLILLPDRAGIQGTLGVTAGGRKVNAYFFSGLSNDNALVIGGVHGSEPSGSQVVEMLLAQLSSGLRPCYNVIIVPTLFPDNRATGETAGNDARENGNVGRYTNSKSVDPNRQMPEFGHSFDPANPVDAMGGNMEPENIMLLNLIDRFRPKRIVSVHAIHNPPGGPAGASAGIFADPRTDASGNALGYDADKDLALDMARLAHSRGADVLGNHLGTRNPTTKYADDPPTATTGNRQERSLGEGRKYSTDPNPHTRRTRGHGYSLGGWASTAVNDPAHPARNRDAITTLTIEIPTGARIEDFNTQRLKDARRQIFQAHVDAIREIFLGSCYPYGPGDFPMPHGDTRLA